MLNNFNPNIQMCSFCSPSELNPLIHPIFNGSNDNTCTVYIMHIQYECTQKDRKSYSLEYPVHGVSMTGMVGLIFLASR